MRIDAGLIIGIVLEFVIMLYFSNSTLKPKKNYYISATIAFVGECEKKSVKNNPSMIEYK